MQYNLYQQIKQITSYWKFISYSHPVKCNVKDYMPVKELLGISILSPKLAVFQCSFFKANSPEGSINEGDNCILCILVLGSICSQTINCTSRGDENAICMNGTCSCTYGYFANSTQNKCQLSKWELLNCAFV